MKRDEYRICANCKQFRSEDRYHGECVVKTEIRSIKGFDQITNLRVRWNSYARNCSKFEGVN